MRQSTLEQWAAGLAAAIDYPLTILLFGRLGTGKSTFARAFLRAASHEIDIPSPTFALVQEYVHLAHGLPIVHADLYRLQQARELAEIGLEEQLTWAIGLIEWPERVPHLQDQPHWQLHFDFTNNKDTRRIIWRFPDDHPVPDSVLADWTAA